jgi:VIT1/CCC1 family predicted Fe2+/Mn2+ transporter
LQASVTSALSFSLGAVIPLLAAAFVQDQTLRLVSIFSSSTLALVVFGAVGAGLGGAPLWMGALRVAVGGWLALGVTWGAGQLFGGV